MNKECNTCNKVKPVDQFYKKHYECKDCSKAYQRERNYTLHGISKLDYEVLLEAQANRCAICGSTEPGSGKARFVIDHDHNCCLESIAAVNAYGDFFVTLAT